MILKMFQLQGSHIRESPGNDSRHLNGNPELIQFYFLHNFLKKMRIFNMEENI